MGRKVSAASTFVRGGQTTQHWWRMGVQVFKFALVVASAAYAGFFVICLFWSYNVDEMRVAIFYEMAERGVLADNGFNKVYSFKDLNGQMVTFEAKDLFYSAVHRAVRDNFFGSIFILSRLSILPAMLAGFLSILVFAKTGGKIQDNEFIRGSRLVSADQLKHWSRQRWRAYHRKFKGRKTSKPVEIAGIPFPPNALEAQTCIYGTVGVGKTNAMLGILEDIRERGGRAIIYDTTGSFVRRFYDARRDVILNPFDNRSRSWNPFDDVLDAASFTQLADVMLPEHRGAASDPFWSQSARVVFEYAARELYAKGPRTVSALKDYIIQLDASELAKLISATPGKHFFNENIEKTAQSIRANLIAELRFLEFLREDAEPFSIRQWMQSDAPSFLFLTGDAEHHAAMRTIISTVLEISANALMSLGPATEPRCFFFIDELPSLNRLPFLVRSLAEIRQFGGAFFLGYQVYSQLEDTYGREAAESISGTTNNRIVFNTGDFRTAKRCSETLGTQDVWEANQNISVGAHEARDGAGLTHNRVERTIVSPAEIQNLPQHVAYIRFAYDAPTARVTMRPVDLPIKAPAFVPYIGDVTGFEPFQPPAPDPESDAEAQRLRADFKTWCTWHFPGAAKEDWSEGALPAAFRAYFEQFRTSHREGMPLEQIKPLVLVTDGLMTNSRLMTPTPGNAVEVDADHADVPVSEVPEPSSDASWEPHISAPDPLPPAASSIPPLSLVQTAFDFADPELDSPLEPIASPSRTF